MAGIPRNYTPQATAPRIPGVTQQRERVIARLRSLPDQRRQGMKTLDRATSELDAEDQNATFRAYLPLGLDLTIQIELSNLGYAFVKDAHMDGHYLVVEF